MRDDGTGRLLAAVTRPAGKGAPPFPFGQDEAPLAAGGCEAAALDAARRRERPAEPMAEPRAAKLGGGQR